MSTKMADVQMKYQTFLPFTDIVKQPQPMNTKSNYSLNKLAKQ